MKAMVVTPLPVTTPSPIASPAFVTYPVSAAFGPHAVHLSHDQRTWLLRVIHSKTYGPKRANLRFTDQASAGVPLVIYVRGPSQDGHDRGGYVIGDRCNILFDPYQRGVFASTEASCTNRPPLPVVP